MPGDWCGPQLGPLSLPAPDDGPLRSRLPEIAAVRRRFGYRRLHILLQREGLTLNHKKLRGIYAEERLQVRRRGGRKRTLGTRAPLTLPQGPKQPLVDGFCA
jgi:putative transposase